MPHGCFALPWGYDLARTFLWSTLQMIQGIPTTSATAVACQLHLQRSLGRITSTISFVNSQRLRISWRSYAVEAPFASNKTKLQLDLTAKPSCMAPPYTGITGQP